MEITVSKHLAEISDKVMGLKESLVQQRKIADHNMYSKIGDASLKEWREHLVSIFATSIIDDQEETYTSLKNWGEDGADLLVNMNLPLDVAIEEVRFYRDTIGSILKDEAIANEFTLEDFYEIISRFDSVVDRAVHWLSISYSTSYASRIYAAEITAMELSIPLVRITETIGILPLIGDIDTNRSQELMEKALLYGSDFNLSHIIIDLSGVPIIDTMVANHIFKVMDGLKLMGIEVLLTGIRPEIAQTMVSLGIEISRTRTFSSLHHGIKYLQTQHQISVF